MRMRISGAFTSVLVTGATVTGIKEVILNDHGRTRLPCEGASQLSLAVDGSPDLSGRHNQKVLP